MNSNPRRDIKFACFNCRKSFERNVACIENTMACPECKKKAFRYDHKFRPPKKEDDKQWKLVQFLKENGFYFQRILKKDGSRAVYPENLREAAVFVKEYADQAIE